MKINTKLAMAGLFIATLVGQSAPQAFAWGCTAVADDGAYGYSNNYPNRKSARQRARAESSARTNYNCQVTSCDPNG